MAGAVKRYAVANSPTYLIQALKFEPAVYSLFNSSSESQLLEKLEISLKSKPATIEDEVWPYIFLAALSLHKNPVAMQHATTLSAPHHPWFRFAANMLALEVIPTTQQKVRFRPSATKVDRTSGSVRASNTTSKICLSDH
jgi:hypothetical protein